MQSRRWWDAAAIAVAIVTGVVASIGMHAPSTSMVAAWASSAAFLLVYFAYARRFVLRPDRTQSLIAAGLFSIVVGVGLAFEPSFAIVQTFIYPFIWVTAASTARAVVANVFVAVAVVLGYTAREGWAGIAGGLAVAGLSLTFSLALGLWITRIAEHGEERGRLLTELQATQGELAAMHRDAGISSERERLAREIHDTIAQSLTGLVMVAQRARRELAQPNGTDAASESVAVIESMAREALTEARALVAAMTPVRVESTLADAIDRLASRFERETGVRVTSRVDPAPLDREQEVVLLRCAQEGLANVRKHARASAASVELSAEAGGVTLEVADDGVGLSQGDDDSGFGLPGMRERVALAGGRLELGVAPAGGVLLRIRLPIADPAEPTGAST